MHLAILHYHLNRGGVTRVIENHLLALDSVLDPRKPWHVALVFGGRQQGRNRSIAERLRAIQLSFVEVPELDYDDQRPTPGAGADELYKSLSSALDAAGFDAAHTVLHIHNHALGKNSHLPAVVAQLADAGYGVLLQIHDFAEDFRPDNYRNLSPDERGGLYPQASNIHYAVLGSRDRGILAAAGVAPEQLHLLPNPVLKTEPLPDRHKVRNKLHRLFDIPADHRFLLYPVRCIRRKNTAEALLYGVLSPPDTTVGLTLAPLNPAEQGVYEMWKQTASELQLPCRFEVGAPGALTFMENLAASDAILTTSLAEGFGMVMLESWLAGRPLLGRDLPEITNDFRRQRLRFDWLRTALRVPVDWIGREAFFEAFAQAYRRVMAAYDRPVPSGLDASMATRIENDLVDFGDLDERQQRVVIEAVCRDADKRQRVLDVNPGLAGALAVDIADAQSAIDHNVRAIDSHFSLDASGRRLLELLNRVAASPRGKPPEPVAHPECVLESFLAVDRFRMIRG